MSNRTVLTNACVLRLDVQQVAFALAVISTPCVLARAFRTVAGKFLLTFIHIYRIKTRCAFILCGFSAKDNDKRMKYLRICNHRHEIHTGTGNPSSRNPTCIKRMFMTNISFKHEGEEKWKEEKRFDITGQAEKLCPFFVSDQQPPLLIAHLPGPTARNQHTQEVTHGLAQIDGILTRLYDERLSAYVCKNCSHLPGIGHCLLQGIDRLCLWKYPDLG